MALSRVFNDPSIKNTQNLFKIEYFHLSRSSGHISDLVSFRPIYIILKERNLKLTLAPNSVKSEEQLEEMLLSLENISA